jgi:predicted O-methyltransferase YrrM
MTRLIRVPMDGMREVRVAVSRGVKARKLTIPPMAATDLFSKPLDLRLIDVDQQDGNTTLQEQILILALAKMRGVRRVFELGTFDGKTSANLAANLGAEADIVTIDIDPMQRTLLPIGKQDLKFVRKERVGIKIDASANILQLYGDTARFDFSPWYGTRDLVFVDACHEYEYVRNDTDVAFRLSHSRGLIIWHDYGTWAGVTRALNEYHSRDPRFRAVRQITGTSICFLELSGEQFAGSPDTA